MEKSNEKRESAGLTNILGLAVRRRREAAKAEAAAAAAEGEYDDDEEYYEEYAENEASHAASAMGDFSAAGSSRAGASETRTSNICSSSAASLPVGTGTSKASPSNANTPKAGPSRVSTPVTDNPKTGTSDAGTSKTGPTHTSHQSSGSSKQVSGQPASGPGPLNPGKSNTGPFNAGRPNTIPSSAAVLQFSARPSNGSHLNAGRPNVSPPSAPPSNVGPSNANISISRAAPFNSALSNISLNAGHQSTSHTNASKAVNNSIMNSEAGQASESVKLAPIRLDQTVNLPLPRLTNPASLTYSAGSSVTQRPNVGPLSTLPPSAIPAPGTLSAPQIARSPTVPAMRYFPPSAARVAAATSLTSMMVPQAPQPSNQTPSQTDDGPVVLDITSLRCFFGVVDQGVGPTSLNDKLFSRPDFFFPIRTPTFPPDASRVNESQVRAPRPSLPSLSSLYPVPSTLAGRASSPATINKGKKRKRASVSRSDVEEDKSGKDKDPAQ